MKRFVVIVLSAGALGACASAGGFSTRPEDIPALEQRVAAEPDNAEAATQLGEAYYAAKRYEDARNALARVVATPNASGDAYLYLGLANEELKDWQAARVAYEQYVTNGPDGEVKERVRSRLALVARAQLRQEARNVLNREQQLSDEPPTERTIAVMPFKLVGISEEMAPLQTALSDMIITDLSVSPALTSIERVKINAMIDEMLLTQAGLAEQETGARVGRLLKAEHVVQGVIAQSGEREVSMDATVLNTARRESAGNFADTQQLDAIFDLEKEIVFDIFNTVGVTLTPAEREKINENRTGNLLAFLTYGRGLEAMDKGNFEQASTFFRQATQLDPNFQPVQTQQETATQLQAATENAPSDVAQVQVADVGDVTALARDLNNDINSTGGEDLTQSKTTNETAPPPTQGVQQTQNQTGNINTSQGNTGGVNNAAKATIRLVITRPGT